ncbi:hypothetical protein BpHYR1_039014 [Brachionus plicatilis]|uniref:Uncharacterized protein n=1 Tax=Brachionus plicatilis TaxID=10195 RepID=A0A3M7T1F7_BRAPC|nr:hypothetical protein BpHYR1_039014 [Brachionus plicatilis]
MPRNNSYWNKLQEKCGKNKSSCWLIMVMYSDTLHNIQLHCVFPTKRFVLFFLNYQIFKHILPLGISIYLNITSMKNFLKLDKDTDKQINK